MADNELDSTASTTGSEEKLQVPKSHELLIKNTWSSYTQKDDQKSLPSQDEEKTIRKRVHKAGDILLFPDNKEGILRTVGPGNIGKRTFCYKMVTGDGEQYFVKVFEDSKMQPTKISKKLFTDKKLKAKFAKCLLLPAFKPQKTPLDAHTYEVVIYPFVKHCNFQDITLKALRQGYINPRYHRQNPPGKPHTSGYKMRLLKKFKEVVNIAIVMKDNGNGYVDMDISPDNFIITTELENAADNDKIKWDTITDDKNAKCIKIDHESMIKWAEQFRYVEKPMKQQFKPPEVNAKNDDDDEYKSFDVEKANIYQFGTTFVYVLYGQTRDTDADGNVYWKSLPNLGNGGWENTNWNPKYLDLVWLQKCVDDRPSKRPNYNQLKRYIEHELNKFQAPPKSSNYIGGNTQHSRKRNNFNQPQAFNNNGQITIIHNPHTLQQQQQYINPQNQQRMIFEQQAALNRQRLLQQQQQHMRRLPQQNRRGLPQQNRRGLPQQNRRGLPQQNRGLPQQNRRGLPQQNIRRIPPRPGSTQTQRNQQNVRRLQQQQQQSLRQPRRLPNNTGNNFTNNQRRPSNNFNNNNNNQRRRNV